MIVRFNVVEEFLDELRADGTEGVDRQIVRVTLELRPTQHFPIRNLMVLASYRVAGKDVLVRLERFVGQIMGDGGGWDASDRKVLDEADTITDRLKVVIHECGLVARAGILEEVVRRERGR